jgi:TraM recognition site of TraD and TraG/Type IV secretory system Conjugative DNA transfer
MTQPPSSIAGLARDAAAPLLLLAALATALLATSAVWVAAGIATLLSTGTWTTPTWSLALLPRLLTDGVAALVGPGASTVAFVAVLGVLAAAAIGVAALGWRRAGLRRDPATRALLRGPELGDLTGHSAQTKAGELRPHLTTVGPITCDQVGIRVGRLDGRDVFMSWEDVALIIMGPRSNKTSALAVPAVRTAPGLAVATSNKADLWALTSGSRAELGLVWVFDPQDIAYHPQQWWWDPLRAIREVPDPHRVEAASRLAGHFMATIGGTRRDPFFHAAGEQVLTGTLLAAALDPTACLAEVVEWLHHGRRDAIIALDTAGADTEAADLHAALSGADVTAKGIFQTARTATKALTSQRILRWVTPPATWREPGPELPELDPWTVLDHTPATLYLLSKEGAGTAAPIVAAIVDRLLDTAERNAQARGGRLDPPVVAVLDEAANICPIRELPQLYSHYGSRGIQVLTMLQSYQQGVGVWGNQGMDALWSAATIKLVGAGVDDQPFLARLAGLIGDHDVPQLAITHARGQGPSRQYSTQRRPVLAVSDLRALSKAQAVLLSTGRPAGLIDLCPWYREPDAADITRRSAAALTALRDTAASTHLTTRGERP